jgi:ABC-2 type transport system permease protein
MRNIWTIASREYRNYFSGITAYLFAFVILLVVGGVFYASIVAVLQSSGYYSVPGAEMITGPMMFVLVFACPALTMRLISEEQRQGTIELLLTAPVRDVELVIGKWLGSFLLVFTLVAVTLLFPVTLNAITEPGIDQGPLIAGYLGVLLVSAAFLAIGVAVSSLFNNQVASFLVTFFVIVIFWWIFGMFAQVSNAGGTSIVSYLNLSSHFYENLYLGVIDLSSVVFMLSLTALSLLLGTVSVETRRWR